MAVYLGSNKVGITIPGSGGDSADVSDAVRFIDYDGTILHKYTKSEFLALSAMPSNPSHTGLVAQGWNWSLSDAKTHVTNWGFLDIGQMYVTTSGATEIDIEIPSGYKRLSPYLSLAVNGEVSIDWGDGSSTDSLTGTSLTNTQSINHTYSTTGNYTIKIGTTTGSYVFYENSNCPILNNNNTSGAAYNTVYSSWVKRIRLGNGSTNMVSSYAFYNCYSLSSITIPSNVTSISYNAFSSCYSLSSVIIPNSVTSIGNNTFNNCYSLSSITIPSGVTNIGSNAFNNCRSLSSVTIPSGVTSIGANAFQNCYALVRRVIPLYGLIKNEGHDYSINGVTSIGNANVFSDWYTLSSITIPSGVTSIDAYAFQNCYNLSSVTIPSGITSIGANAFQNCSALSSITIPSGVTSIGINAFQNCYNLSSVTISSGITSIGSYAFSTCHNLSSITIPSGVTSIGSYAFQGCSTLSSIAIPSSVTSIGSQTFYNCYSLSSVTIPSSVTSIGTNAFQYCRSLTSITIPSSVTSIGSQAFSGCYGMKEYHFLSGTPPTLSNTNAFSGIPSDCIIYVPQGSLSAYQTANNWSTYASYMQEESA